MAEAGLHGRRGAHTSTAPGIHAFSEAGNSVGLDHPVHFVLEE